MGTVVEKILNLEKQTSDFTQKNMYVFLGSGGRKWRLRHFAALANSYVEQGLLELNIFG